MTDDDTSRRLRAALEPTDTDHATSQRLVDEVLVGGGRPDRADGTASGSDPGTSADRASRRRRLLPAAAAATAAVLAGGVGLTALLRDDAPDHVATAPETTPATSPVPGTTPTPPVAPVPASPLSPTTDTLMPEEGRPEPRGVTATCTETGVEVDSPTVIALGLGVPVHLVNDTGEPVTVELEPATAGVTPVPATQVQPGARVDLHAQLPPGAVTVNCARGEDASAGPATPAADLTVEDPDGRWQGSLDERLCTGWNRGRLAAPVGRGATPQAAVVNYVASGVTPGAPAAQGVLTQRIAAGYPEATEQYWSVRDAGGSRTILLVRPGADGYVATALGACAPTP